MPTLGALDAHPHYDRDTVIHPTRHAGILTGADGLQGALLGSRSY
jgi:hypothetical protein